MNNNLTFHEVKEIMHPTPVKIIPKEVQESSVEEERKYFSDETKLCPKSKPKHQ